MPDTYPASLNGFPLQIETISDTFAKAIARYEFPYKDGAQLEDMGQKAHTIRVRCYFWDAAGNQTYDEHKDFIDSLAQQTLFEFVHPTYGPMMGGVDTVSVTQDDRERTAEVDIEFVENLRGTTQTMQDYPAQDVMGSCEDAFSACILQTIAAFGAEAMAFLGAEASIVATTVLNPAEAILGQFVGLSWPAYGFVEAVSQGITALGAILPNVANSTTSLLAATSFAPTLPGMLTQSIAQCCERYILWRQGIEANPTNWSSTISADITALIATFTSSPAASPAAVRVNTATIPKLLWMQAASAAALELASIYAADQANWTTAEQSQLENAFDMLGNYVYPDVPGAQLMTQADLQQTLSDVRTIIQNAIDFARANDVPPSCVASSVDGAGSSLDSLKEAALALQAQVESELLERSSLIQVMLANPLPLHLVCLMYGLPYNTAEQLWAVNRKDGLSNPNAVSGQVWVYQQAPS
jgi:prophage DNA circulation protein